MFLSFFEALVRVLFTFLVLLTFSSLSAGFFLGGLIDPKPLLIEAPILAA
jgi:hypothetical protein